MKVRRVAGLAAFDNHPVWIPVLLLPEPDYIRWYCSKSGLSAGFLVFSCFWGIFDFVRDFAIPPPPLLQLTSVGVILSYSMKLSNHRMRWERKRNNYGASISVDSWVRAQIVHGSSQLYSILWSLDFGVGIFHDFSLIILAEKSFSHRQFRPEFDPSSARAKFSKAHYRERCAVRLERNLASRERYSVTKNARSERRNSLLNVVWNYFSSTSIFLIRKVTSNISRLQIEQPTPTVSAPTFQYLYGVTDPHPTTSCMHAAPTVTRSVFVHFLWSLAQTPEVIIIDVPSNVLRFDLVNLDWLLALSHVLERTLCTQNASREWELWRSYAFVPCTEATVFKRR